MKLALPDTLADELIPRVMEVVPEAEIVRYKDTGELLGDVQQVAGGQRQPVQQFGQPAPGRDHDAFGVRRTHVLHEAVSPAGDLREARAGLESARRCWEAGEDPGGVLDPRHASFVGLYPVARLAPDLEAEVGPYRTAKDTVRFVYRDGVPYDLVERIAGPLGSSARASRKTQRLRVMMSVSGRSARHSSPPPAKGWDRRRGRFRGGTAAAGC